MDLIPVQVGPFRLQFRPLGWVEQFPLSQLEVSKHHRAVLEASLVSAGEVPVKSLDEARRVLNTLPNMYLSKLWLLYSSGLKPNRIFTTIGLSVAPKVSDVERKAIKFEEDSDREADAALEKLKSQFGAENVKEAQEIDRKILEAAKKRGALITPVGETK